MDEFLLRAVLAGCGLALATGPFGCLVVWRRMAYFGDTLAHGALLGVVLGLWAGQMADLGILVVALGIAAAQGWLMAQRRLASDTVLGILSHTTLALGLVLLSLMDQIRVNLVGWLLGDILAVTWGDVGMIWAGAGLALMCLWRLWPTLLAMAVDEDLAAAEGHPIHAGRYALLLLTALLVALAMKVVGILLVTAMLIIPAAAARPLSATPEAMAGSAALLGMMAVVAGLLGSWQFDTPSGPSIVVAAAAIFGVTHAATAFFSTLKPRG